MDLCGWRLPSKIITVIIIIIFRWTPVATKTVAVSLLRRPSHLRVGSDKRLIRWLMTEIKDMTLRRVNVRIVAAAFMSAISPAGAPSLSFPAKG